MARAGSQRAVIKYHYTVAQWRIQRGVSGCPARCGYVVPAEVLVVSLCGGHEQAFFECIAIELSAVECGCYRGMPA